MPGPEWLELLEVGDDPPRPRDTRGVGRSSPRDWIPHLSENFFGGSIV
jgi:hypothetical protein